MLKIGITGGIGSGKTTVCSIFEQLGVPVYNADARAKALMTEDPKLVSEIKSLFGPEAYSGKTLNRKYIGERAFGNPELLNRLNAAVHPVVIRDFHDWVKQQDSPYVLKEAALLYEAETYRDLDYVITVYAPRELRIARTMERDGVSRKQVMARMKKQWTEKQRLEAADFVIKNDGKHSLIKQVLELHKRFLFSAEE